MNSVKKSKTGIIIDDSSSTIKFNLYNMSEYNQSFVINLEDSLDIINSMIDTFMINAMDSMLFSIESNMSNEIINKLSLTVYPLYHDYNKKDYNFSIHKINGNILKSDLDLDIMFKLHQNYPNPFNPITTLRYDLPEDALVNVTIYDMTGRLVKNMVNMEQSAGYKSIHWNATNYSGQSVSAGLYLYTIQAGEFRQTKKMLLLK